MGGGRTGPGILCTRDRGWVRKYTKYVGHGGPYPKWSPNIHIYVGPGAPHAKDPWGSTNIHTHVGPGGPIIMPRTPGGPTICTHLCGGLVRQGPRGGHHIYINVGPGGPYAKDPGGSTYIHMYVGPEAHRDPREVSAI
jgi:hypothetical protein